MKRYSFLFLLSSLFLLLLFSCSGEERDENGLPIVRADRSAKSKLIDLFGKVQLIPLETTDSSLIAEIKNAKVVGDALVFFDTKQSALFMFNDEGKYLNKIARKGQGPEEYLLIEDFRICPEKTSIDILCSYGSILSYAMNGDFIEKIKLPGNLYHSLEYLNADTIVLWSSLTEESDCIRIIQKETKETITSYRKGNPILDGFYPFHRKNGTVYFSTYYDHHTYRLTLSELIEEYVWDFGEETYHIDPERFTGKREENKAEMKDKFDSLKNGSIPYVLGERAETADYYYLEIYENQKTRKSFFVHKESRKSYCFAADDKHIHLNPLCIEDDYVLSEIRHEDIPRYIASGLLSEKDKQLLSQLSEDENPVIAKLLFK